MAHRPTSSSETRTYMGDRKMRRAFGDGYVDALRSTYDEVPNGADYVMHWWYRAAEAVCSGNCIRAGLIRPIRSHRSGTEPL